MAKITRMIKKSDPKGGAHQVMVAINELYEFTDKDIRVTIEAYNETRKIIQNKLLWVWHGQFQTHRCLHFGENLSTKGVHQAIVSVLLPSTFETVFGKDMVILGKTSKLNVKEFAEFLTKYEILAADDGCTFTQPPDQYFDALMKQLDKEECTGNI